MVKVPVVSVVLVAAVADYIAILGPALAWELVRAFLDARFTGEERHRRRLAKVAEVERQQSGP